jgi:hypothetical protein
MMSKMIGATTEIIVETAQIFPGTAVKMLIIVLEPKMNYVNGMTIGAGIAGIEMIEESGTAMIAHGVIVGTGSGAMKLRSEMTNLDGTVETATIDAEGIVKIEMIAAIVTALALLIGDGTSHLTVAVSETTNQKEAGVLVAVRRHQHVVISSLLRNSN